MKVVVIKKEGNMDDIQIKITKKNIINNLTSITSSQGNGSIKLLYSWLYGDSTIECYGWCDGEAGFENKHDLPPSGNSKFLDCDSSEILLFGDIILVKNSKSKYCNFEISDYGEFYNNLFGGFDDCDSDIDSINSEESVDEDYKPDKDSESEDELINEVVDDDSELDEDYNTY
jgi:hypothetical protein